MFKAFITNLGKYNEGALVGEWLEFPCDEDDFNACLERIGISDEPDEDGNYYEEWFVTDYECEYPTDELGEYESYETLNQFGEILEDAEEYGSDCIEDCMYASGYSLEETVDALNNGDIVYYPGIETEDDLGYYVIDEIYGNDIPADLVETYLDYDSLGRDLGFDSYEVENDDYDPDDPDSEEYIYVSAGEYWCGDENASDSEIGEEYVSQVGIDGVSNIENYFDYESFGRDLTFENFTICNNGTVEIT